MIGEAINFEHVGSLQQALTDFTAESWRLHEWGLRLADLLASGGRVLVAGNGGSAAEAQHLAAELVGRFDHDRAPFSAIALHAETSSLTAIANDYGYAQVFARQVRAHARPGDVLIGFSTSGASENLLAAARAARQAGAWSWAMTGRLPNPLAELCDDAVGIPSDSAQTVQEVHLMCVHLLCRHIEVGMAAAEAVGLVRSAP